MADSVAPATVEGNGSAPSLDANTPSLPQQNGAATNANPAAPDTSGSQKMARVPSAGPLLAAAANNDVQSLKDVLANNADSGLNAFSDWYSSGVSAKSIECVRRNPVMIAAFYGSLESLNLLLCKGADANLSSSDDGYTALHCAAAGGSDRVVQTVALLLRFGADREALDVRQKRPADVIFMSKPRSERPGEVVTALECMLGADVQINMINSNSKENACLAELAKAEYQSDEFRMYDFKVRPCPKTRSHDWTMCPFAHPGEKARRRDPRRFAYSGVACPDFRKGSCRKGDACEFAHGVFECWLHPSRYRTQLCKDGKACPRRVCFFAHAASELRDPPTGDGDVANGKANVQTQSPVSPLSQDSSPTNSPPSTEDFGEGLIQASQVQSALESLTILVPDGVHIIGNGNGFMPAGTQTGVRLPANGVVHPGQANFLLTQQAMATMGLVNKGMTIATASAPSFVPESRREGNLRAPVNGAMLSVPEKGDGAPLDSSVPDAAVRQQIAVKAQQGQAKKGMPRSQSYLQMEMENSHWVDNMISDLE
mmetsp:Transcript_13531/g.49235  ORF Transcript_13531/g.49235 Transcript_13531/m.49235 type:complete len:541 (-) Transcript_13531:627-2249(-)|eukprot:scaffold3171_cov380-Prasinococcus_capsulatus_cf.AAC.10